MLRVAEYQHDEEFAKHNGKHPIKQKCKNYDQYLRTSDRGRGAEKF